MMHFTWKECQEAVLVISKSTMLSESFSTHVILQAERIG